MKLYLNDIVNVRGVDTSPRIRSRNGISLGELTGRLDYSPMGPPKNLTLNADRGSYSMTTKPSVGPNLKADEIFQARFLKKPKMVYKIRDSIMKGQRKLKKYQIQDYIAGRPKEDLMRLTRQKNNWIFKNQEKSLERNKDPKKWNESQEKKRES
jgi:hypothetical protein